MSKKLLAVTLALLVAAVSPSLAKDMTGKLSLGFHNSDAPIGGRYWVNNMIAVDAGVGFNSVDFGDSSALSFFLEGGVPIKLYDVDNAHFFFRPSVVVGFLDDRVYGTGTRDAKWTNFNFILSLGGELFFGDHFSVDATHGIAIVYLSAPDELGGKSSTSFSTFGNNLTSIGFHFYF